MEHVLSFFCAIIVTSSNGESMSYISCIMFRLYALGSWSGLNPLTCSSSLSRVWLILNVSWSVASSTLFQWLFPAAYALWGRMLWSWICTVNTISGKSCFWESMQCERVVIKLRPVIIYSLYPSMFNIFTNLIRTTYFPSKSWTLHCICSNYHTTCISKSTILVWR